jgi:ketosteroid isomerase-like protein
LVARLALILQQQKESMAMGLRVASEQNIYESQVELTKASDFSAPQRFWTDPATLPPPTPPDPTKDPVFVMEQMKKSFDQQMAAMKIESEERIKTAELLAKDQLAKLDAEVKILIEQMKGGQSESLEVLRGAIKNEPAIKSNQSLDQIANMVNEVSSKNDAVSQQLMEALNAPREVLRGPDGKVAGVRINGKDRMVRRDKDGRVLGVQ